MENGGVEEEAKPANFNQLRAKFARANGGGPSTSAQAAPSSNGHVANVGDRIKFFEHSRQHEPITSTVAAEWNQQTSTNTLKKCSSELTASSIAAARPPVPKKPEFLRAQNGRSSSVQEMIERLNSSNIPLAGALMGSSREEEGATAAANEAQMNASTSELSEVSDDQQQQPSVRPTLRSNSSFHYGDLHKSIIEEMRASGHFKKIPSIRSKLPKEIGQVRTQRTRQVIAQLPSTSEEGANHHLNIDSWCSSATNSMYNNNKDDGSSSFTESGISVGSHDCHNKPASIIGSTSNSSDDTSLFETYEYYSGKDEKENQQFAELHNVVFEICNRQRTFLRLLRNICRDLVPFIRKLDEKTRHKAFVKPDGGKHILEVLSAKLEPIVQVHEFLHDAFSKKFSTWSALAPDFADVFVRNADFLKICSEFLLEKSRLTGELIRAMEHNKHLAQAIRLFEEGVLNAPESGAHSTGSSISPYGGGISLVMHLDAVHQNVVRYVILMERYRKSLPAGIPECDVADKAIAKLKSVSEEINCSLEEPDYKNKLMEIHRKMQGAFDVFALNRRLIHEGRLKKQTARNDLQERHIVLFSDWILVCRYAYPWDYFDIAKTYRIPIKEIEVSTIEHVDHEREFDLKNPTKSIRFVADTKEARDEWIRLITETKNRWLEAERKWQEQRRKLSVAPLQDLKESVDTPDDKTPTDPNVGFLTLKEKAPVTNGDHASPSKSSVQYDPLWIPDNKVNNCMLQECQLKFTRIRRRHHCRNCGYIICGDCSGKAPVKVKNYERERVCSECYDNILEAFVKLEYFPIHMVVVTDERFTTSPSSDEKPTNEKPSNNRVHPTAAEKPNRNAVTEENRPGIVEALREHPFADTIRIKYEGGVRHAHPRDLFKEPTNKHYHRSATLQVIADKVADHETNLLISGKVHLSNKKGHMHVRWARLDSDYLLKFYEAELDAIPTETIIVYGYDLLINENPRGHSGAEFTLLHQNQVKTDSKDLRVVFLVEHEAAVDKWREALTTDLGLTLLNADESAP